jgi:hypothetical protein
VVRFDVRKVNITITRVEIDGFCVISSKLLEEVMVKAEQNFECPDGH